MIFVLEYVLNALLMNLPKGIRHEFEIMKKLGNRAQRFHKKKQTPTPVSLKTPLTKTDKVKNL
jgi:hypothetical protein